jgi:hypothetical protein
MMIVHRHFLKITILIFCLVLMQCQGQKKDSHQQSDDISTPTFFLKRGVNISHWLSQSKVRG